MEYDDDAYEHLGDRKQGCRLDWNELQKDHPSLPAPLTAWN